MGSTKGIYKTIIAGAYKGKKIYLPSKETTRSSKAIVLESLLNTIQFEIIDATFVELFSGSGSVGLEALSRGAGRVIFMEKDSEALKVLYKNIDQTDPSRTEVIRGDTFENISGVIKALQRRGEKAYFYIDPPFAYREGMEAIYDQTIALIAALPREVVRLIIIEHMSTLELDAQIGGFTCSKSKRFGKTSLSYYM
ncbi:MAG: 16S rRNA (guanine(966)-N(2))-methyltransferase RsmD [Campylobacterales bacterium]|nr:16S rRNA (guanine(966)-N(2))-methyltransferase RsmD [Campylobacterales bacterium]